MQGRGAGTPVPFEGAKFEYFAANVFDTSTGKTIFPAYAIKTYNGVKVAFIGLTLKDTPTIVAPAALPGCDSPMKPPPSTQSSSNSTSRGSKSS